MSKQGENLNEFIWARNQLQAYCDLYYKYKKYAEVLGKILETAAKKYAPLAIVQTRSKSVSSFGEKIWRKSDPSKDPVHEFTDLCGGRIITHTRTEVNAICAFIKKNFEIDEENSIDSCERLKPSEFGYHSVHFIVSIKPRHFPTEEVKIKVPQIVLGLKAEIQIKTLLEHAWADFTHDRSYKSQFTIPTKWQRELATIAANLESVDNDFVRIQSGLASYATSYGAYMTKEEMQSQIKKLELVLEFDKNNLEIVHRIGKLAMTFGDWEKAIAIFSEKKDSNYQPILRDLGVSLCQKYKDQTCSEEYVKGQEYLIKACKLLDSDSDAYASLAGTYKRKKEDKEKNKQEAKRLYFEAHKRDPSNSYPIVNYLNYYISQNTDPDALNLYNSVMETSIQRCREQVEVGINLPWAYFDMATFSLLLERPYESLTYYSKAIDTSTAAWMISTTLTSLCKVEKFWVKKEGFEWIKKLLLLGLFTKLTDDDKEEKASCLIEIKKQSTNVPFLQPIIIVAGNGSTDISSDFEKYQRLMDEGFRNYRGTIISGGTTTGISSIVGSIAKKYKIVAIGYTPNFKKTSNIDLNNNYTIRCTDSDDFSPLEPLQYWIDIIASGLQPSQVKLLGIGGGKISATEYRIALALGAIVGIVDESGGEAKKLLSDPDWADSPNLICLPYDRETLHAFTILPKPILNQQIRETLAKAIHNQYRKTVAGSRLSSDPAMLEWENLSQSLKDSNLQQSDAIFEKLERIKCGVKEVLNRPVALITFTEKEIEIMAEMEHGRWNVERLLKGWKQAKTRNVDKKLTPYIVSWLKLPFEVKKWDKETVNKIPDFLAQVGLEIQRNK